MYKDYEHDVLFSFYEKKIEDYLSQHKKTEAQKEAFLWLQEYVDSLCITIPWNWKLAKKQIAAYYFGKTKSVQLHYESNIERGINFISDNHNCIVRCSYHKFDSACHSESRRIDAQSIEWLIEIKKGMREKDIIDLFTETSSPTTTCFRRLSSQYNERVSYEMGFGQAMYVFEKNRGQHDVASADSNNGIFAYHDSNDPQLLQYLKSLIFYHESMLAIKSHMICYYLGIPQISIEGYFDTKRMHVAPLIVDIDLPFDRAFF